MGAVAGLGLGIAAKVFHVDVDPRIDQVYHALPTSNCGACGYPGCMGFAEAVILEGAPVDGCPPGGAETAEVIAKLMGAEVIAKEKMVAMVMCGGGEEEAPRKFDYQGILDCQAAYLLGGGDKSCSYGCLGYSTCNKACPFDAIITNDKGLSEIVRDKCTGCEICVKVCPVNVIKMVPYRSMVHVLCNSSDKGPQVRKACTVGCIACMLCQKACPNEAIKVEDFLAAINYDLCTHERACIEVCPTNCIVDLEASPEAVEEVKAEVES
jgi:electron transport complex protein RnfB